MTILEALKQTTESIAAWVEGRFFKKGETTADDFGIYVQDTEPVDAVDGDIWVDTANDPSYIVPTIPEVTTSDNGKVLMVVNGTWQAIALNMSVDTNGVVSM
jgi:hypothetical protein